MALGGWAPRPVSTGCSRIIVAATAGVVVAGVAASITAASLSRVVDRVDFASKLLTVTGLLIGLTWALFKLVVSPAGFVDEIGEKTYSNLRLDLTCETLAYRNDLPRPPTAAS